MSTYKRPLLEGEVCEDLRSQYNSNLGMRKAVTAPVAETVEPQVVAKAPKKEKEVSAKEVAVEEIAEDIIDELPLDMVVG